MPGKLAALNMELLDAHLIQHCGEIKVKVDGGRIESYVRLPPPSTGLGLVAIIVVL